MERIGIYGGTFNPPHAGHIQAAKQAVTALKLDKLVIVPTSIAPPDQRYRVDSAGNDQLLLRHADQFQITAADTDQTVFHLDSDFLPAVFLDAEVVFDQHPAVAGDLHNGLPRQRLCGKVSPVRQPLQNHSSLPHETSPLGKSI